MRFPLPILTGSYAHGAKPIGAFGMVARPLTIAYHLINLALRLPCVTFTNHYHRDGGQGIEPNVPFRVGQYRWRWWLGGQGIQRGTAWRTVGTLRKGHTVVVGVEKKKEKI